MNQRAKLRLPKVLFVLLILTMILLLLCYNKVESEVSMVFIFLALFMAVVLKLCPFVFADERMTAEKNEDLDAFLHLKKYHLPIYWYVIMTCIIVCCNIPLFFSYEDKDLFIILTEFVDILIILCAAMDIIKILKARKPKEHIRKEILAAFTNSVQSRFSGIYGYDVDKISRSTSRYQIFPFCNCTEKMLSFFSSEAEAEDRTDGTRIPIFMDIGNEMMHYDGDVKCTDIYGNLISVTYADDSYDEDECREDVLSIYSVAADSIKYARNYVIGLIIDDPDLDIELIKEGLPEDCILVIFNGFDDFDCSRLINPQKMFVADTFAVPADNEISVQSPPETDMLDFFDLRKQYDLTAQNYKNRYEYLRYLNGLCGRRCANISEYWPQLCSEINFDFYKLMDSNFLFKTLLRKIMHENIQSNQIMIAFDYIELCLSTVSIYHALNLGTEYKTERGITDICVSILKDCQNGDLTDKTIPLTSETAEMLICLSEAFGYDIKDDKIDFGGLCMILTDVRNHTRGHGTIKENRINILSRFLLASVILLSQFLDIPEFVIEMADNDVKIGYNDNLISCGRLIINHNGNPCLLYEDNKKALYINYLEGKYMIPELMSS